MSEVKVMNFILSSLLLMTVALFSWTYCYLNEITSETYPPTSVAAFSG